MRKSLVLCGCVLFFAAATTTLVSCWHGRDTSESAILESPWFHDVTAKVGLDFTHDAGPVGSYFMPQSIGSGAALFDFDGDGLLDIYLLQKGGPKSASCNRLFKQLPDHTFKDVSAGSGLDIAGHNMGVAIGDINNDGRPDVLVTQYQGVRLFLNEGNGRFRDITADAGLSNPAWGTSAAFCDYDRDGWLDLVVVNYVAYDPSWPCSSPSGRPDYCPPRVFPGTVSRLFHNRGTTPPRFEDVTVSSGLGRAPAPGLGVVCADFDGDGWQDIFIANDGKANHLWINRHDGTFTEEALARGLAYNVMGDPEAGMGVALGDVDNDGMFDVFVTHLREESHTLWLQGPRGLFRDQTAASGLRQLHWRGTGFGTFMGDFNHDGALDIALVNGRVSRALEPVAPELGPHWSYYADRNQLLANDGAGKFRDVSPANPELCGKWNVARGLAVGDIDGDGALDLLVTTIAGPARLYRNAANGGHWLIVRALDPVLKRDAYGAEVRVRAGERRWLRLLQPAASYLCSSDPRVHFGLGDLRKVDEIEVVWPDGTVEMFDGCAADRVIELSKGNGRRKSVKSL
jgi:enediyne biosynthesis protein E4